jgi:hypothetical protein
VTATLTAVLTCAWQHCDEEHPGTRAEASAWGWLVASPDPAVPVLCPLHGDNIAAGRQTFGPEYETLPSRVPVIGDLLITPVGRYMRVLDSWVLEGGWPA